MTSRRTPADKRAKRPRTSDYAKSFLKDWERLSQSGKYDLHRLKEAMMLLIANEAPLGPEWSDHSLQGAWQGCRECHIGGDFLLIYKLQKDSKDEQIVFVRTGTHAELFE